MSLEDLNKAVYKRDFQSSQPRDDADRISDTIASHEHQHITPSSSVWTDAPPKKLAPAMETEKQEREHKARRRKFILILSLGFLSLFMLAGFVGQRLFLFDTTSVDLQVTGPEMVQTGDELTLLFDYKNDNLLGLTDVELSLTFPESFKPQATGGWKLALSRATYTIPVIPGKSSGQLKLTGTLQAFEKKTAFFKAVLRSSPRGITNPTEVIGQWTVAVDTSSLKLEITGPPSLTLGQSLEYVVKYRNESTEMVDNIQLLLDYPEGFTPTSFVPNPSREENRWVLSRLEPRSEGTISIKGEIRGIAGDARRLIARLGKEQGDGEFLSLAQEEKLTKVLSPPLSVSLDVDNNGGSVDSGQFLLNRIFFRNNSNVGIRDIVATVKLDAEYLSMEGMTIPQGVSYDRSRQQLVFRASEIPELRSLEPGEQGDISFGVKVKSNLSDLGRRNIQIRTSVSLDSPDLPHGQNTEAFVPQSESLVKVNSFARPLIQVEYADAQFPNSGPFPPKIGETTTYTVRLAVSTDLNTLNDARWTMTLPSSVQFTSVLAGESNSLKYNIRTGELVWDLRSLEPGESNARQAVFQISFIPAPGGLKPISNLINNGVFIAKDSFTGKSIEVPVAHVAAGHILE